MRRNVILLFINVAICTAYALPNYESFNYPAGLSLIGQTNADGLVWVAAGPGGTPVTIRSGNLSVFGLAPSVGNSVQFSGAIGPSARLPVGFTITSGTLYYSFALKVVDLTGLGTNGGFLAGFNNSIGAQGNTPTNVAARVLIRPAGENFHLGVSKASASPTNAVWSAYLFSTNETLFLVGSYTINAGNNSNDVAQLWINPDPADFGATNSASVPLLATVGPDTTANQIASFIFFQRGGFVQPALCIADELRIGRTWADVTSTNAPVRDCPFPVCPGQRGIVQCLDFPDKNYDIYLPPTYSPTNDPLPILYTFNPNGNGMVGNFGAVASEMQIIVVGIRESSNAVNWWDFIDAVYAIVRDIRQRVHFDPTAEFAAGFSGGGWESYMHSQIRLHQLAGVLAMSACMPNFGLSRYMTNLLVARIYGTGDSWPNSCLSSDAERLRQAGAQFRDWPFPGGHVIASDPLKTEALTWLISQRIKPGPTDKSDAEAKAVDWRTAINTGDAERVFRECLAALISKPRSYEAHRAQFILDELQSDYTKFRILTLTNLAGGDYAADYFYYRAFGAGKIGDSNTYYSCLKSYAWLRDTSGDRTDDFRDLMLQFGFSKPVLELRINPTNHVAEIFYRKDANGLIYTVQQTTALTSSAWTPLSAAPTDHADGTFSFPLQQDQRTQQFFRLAADIE